MTFLKERSDVLIIAALVLAGVVSAPWAWTQQPGAPATQSNEPVIEAFRGVARIGKTWDAAAFAETARLYMAIQRAVEWPGIREPETVHYGPDAQQTLRLFRPEQGFSEPGPVFLFLHGNGLEEADDVVPASDSLLYDNVGKLGARFGGIGIMANYRTGGSASNLSGAEDLKLVLEWIAAHIAAYGGDPRTVVLLANSQGATNAAMYLFDEGLQTKAGPGLAAAVLSSGLFGDAAPGLRSLIERYDGQRVPIALWSAQYDPAAVEIGVAALYEQLCRKYQQCPWFEQLHGYNHVSQVMSLGTSDTSVQNGLIRFYHTVR